MSNNFTDRSKWQDAILAKPLLPNMHFFSAFLLPSNSDETPMQRSSKMLHKGTFTSFFCSLLVLTALTPAAAHAFMVTIEPDDYASGADLSNVSPYVTLRSVEPGGSSPIQADSTRIDGSNIPAPTGNLTFGNHAGGVGWAGCCGDMGGPAGAAIHDYLGFGMFFNQEVDQVSLLATNFYPPGLNAIWAAFDQNGNLIGQGGSGPGNYGETFLVDIQLTGIWSLLIGGDATTGSIEFDQLQFEVEDSTVVPEPGPLSLYGVALLLAAWRLRRSV